MLWAPACAKARPPCACRSEAANKRKGDAAHSGKMVRRGPKTSSNDLWSIGPSGASGGPCSFFVVGPVFGPPFLGGPWDMRGPPKRNLLPPCAARGQKVENRGQNNLSTFGRKLALGGPLHAEAPPKQSRMGAVGGQRDGGASARPPWCPWGQWQQNKFHLEFCRRSAKC